MDLAAVQCKRHRHCHADANLSVGQQRAAATYDRRLRVRIIRFAPVVDFVVGVGVVVVELYLRHSLTARFVGSRLLNRLHVKKVRVQRLLKRRVEARVQEAGLAV